MHVVAALFFGFALAGPTERDELVRRGYELLPDARWLEELERDRNAAFLGVSFRPPVFAEPMPIPLDFVRLDYDREALYPEDAPIALIDLDLRPWSHWWNRDTTPLFPTSPRFPHEPWFMTSR